MLKVESYRFQFVVSHSHRLKDVKVVCPHGYFLRRIQYGMESMSLLYITRALESLLVNIEVIRLVTNYYTTLTL